MSCTIWATADVEPERRFDYYRAGLCASFVQLTPGKPQDASRFEATMRHWVTGGCEFTLLAASTHEIVRNRRDLAEAADDHVYLNFVGRGELWMDQLGQRQRVRPGEIILVDNAREFHAELRKTNDHRLLVYRVDRRRVASGMAAATQRLARHDLSPTLRQMLAYASAIGPEWGDAEIGETARVVDGLLTLILGADPDCHLASRSRGTLRRVRELIAMRYSDPELSLLEAAHEVGLSRRALQEHLAAQGQSFSRMLSAYRVAKARERLLAVPRSEMSIESVGYACGFRDLSTFYRVFRRHCGHSPGATRL